MCAHIYVLANTSRWGGHGARVQVFTLEMEMDQGGGIVGDHMFSSIGIRCLGYRQYTDKGHDFRGCTIIYVCFIS